MNENTLRNYYSLTRIDSVLSGIRPKYPFQLNERAKYTQHQITLYKGNFCKTTIEETQEQPSIMGGSTTDIVFIDF